MITLYTKPVSVNQKYNIANGRNILSKKYRDAKEALKWEIKSQWHKEPLDEDVCLNIIFYFGNKRKNDIDNLLKCLLDSAEGILFTDDSLVTELHCYKEYDKENPRVEVTVL